MKRTAMPRRKAPIRPVMRKTEIRKWTVLRWRDAEKMLRQVVNDLMAAGISHPTLQRASGFVGAYQARPKRRVRAKGRARTETEALDDLVREIVFHRDGYRCLRCGASREAGAELHASHIRGKGAHPSMRWEIENVITLDKRCHITGPDAFHAPDTRPAQEWLRSHFGDEYLARLDLLAASRKGTRTDKAAVRLYLEAELRRTGAA